MNDDNKTKAWQSLCDLFDKEKKSNYLCHECCKWIIKHGKIPSQTSKDPIEKRNGLWLNTQRQAKAGKGHWIFYASNLEIVNKYKLPNLFEQINLEKESNAMCHECCKWTKKHGKTPSKDSKDPIEKKLGIWLSSRKQSRTSLSSRKVRRRCRFYSSDLIIAQKYGLPDLFKQIDLEKESNASCHECCKWTVKHGKKPSSSSKDPIEKKYGQWLVRQCQAKAGTSQAKAGTRIRCKFYTSNLTIAKKYGLPDLFEQIDLEKESNASCHECCKWTVKHGKKPSSTSKDPIEKKLGNWLRGQVEAKKGVYGRKFYLSNLAIAKKYGLLDLFEYIDLEKESNAICHECCKWTLKHGTTPSLHSKNKDEKRNGKWLSRQRQAKRGKGTCTFYPSNLAIAKKYGLQDMFDNKKS